MSEAQPRIWALLGHRKGDNNQVLALAQGLGLPFETRSMRYNVLRRLDNRLLGRAPCLGRAKRGQMAAAAVARPGHRHRPAQRPRRALHPPRLGREDQARPARQSAHRPVDFRPHDHPAAIRHREFRPGRCGCRWRWASPHAARSRDRRGARVPRCTAAAAPTAGHRRAEQALVDRAGRCRRRRARARRAIRSGGRHRDCDRQPANRGRRCWSRRTGDRGHAPSARPRQRPALRLPAPGCRRNPRHRGQRVDAVRGRVHRQAGRNDPNPHVAAGQMAPTRWPTLACCSRRSRTCETFWNEPVRSKAWSGARRTPRRRNA